MGNSSRWHRAVMLSALPACLVLACCAASTGGPKNRDPEGSSARSEPRAAADPAEGGAEASSHDTAADVEAGLKRGLQWLLENQNAEGSWGAALPERPYDIYLGGLNSLHVFGNASSALCCMALLMQPSDEQTDAALLRGYGYLCDAPDTPRTSGNTFYNVWAHAYMMEALAYGLADTRLADLHEPMRNRAELELRRALMHQSLDGGWGYYDFTHKTYHPSGDLSTPFTTAAMLVGMHAVAEAGIDVDQHAVKCGLDYLERMRIPSGAYFYSTGHQYYPQGRANYVRGSLGRSQAGDNALFTWGRTLDANDIHDAMERFFTDHVFIEIGRCRQFPHEAWYATAPYYYYFGHYYAARNLDIVPEEDRPNFATQLAEIVVAGQFDDGSFWDYPLYGYTKAYGTGYGVLILSHCRRHLRVSTDREPR